ncbi:hypothetical protein [Pseudomonas schmalbachii]|uniref:Uncharacterized protein n=1 Tax=Pseudomonas schmalbachii TaxID=2816993 RepID=A0ABS3TTC8_9PSED|nr:hypothetical protein [Pseudomonas schmalbachii]MBO3276623.1 hypothetical protein [Pseudomonas schmalbachii]
MYRRTRNLRKTLDSVAASNEAAAIEAMRAVDQLKDELLRQRLLKAIHELNQGAAELRMVRDELPGQAIRLA